jgi:hypothetical protein
MQNPAKRTTVDLSAYPDLVIIYLGMRVNTLAGIGTVLGFGPKISRAVSPKAEGLLLHERLIYSLRHIGMRQYWRDFESLENWARSEPHRTWWREFLRDTGGTGFWHETYFRRGGVEAVYVGMESAVGLSAFAPAEPARGAMFSARSRAGAQGAGAAAPAFEEEELYRDQAGLG